MKYSHPEFNTPKDYTDTLYFVYFEVGEYEDKVKRVIEAYLGEDRRERLQAFPHGYLVEIAIQSTPEIVRALAEENIAVYQVKRMAKNGLFGSSWDV